MNSASILEIPFNHPGISHRIRLYSTRNLKPLGTLYYHKSGCQGLAFAHSYPHTEDDGSDEEDDLPAAEMEERGRWLLAGAKDNRVSLWVLMSFEKG